MINKVILKLINFFTFGYGVKTVHNQEHTEFTLNGAGTLHEVIIHTNLLANGTATLNKVLVGQTLSVNGSLSATDSTMRKLESNGYTVLKNCQIDESICANGFIELTDCKDCTITIKGTIRAKGSTFKSILVQKAWSGKHVVDLTDTIIQGDVVFQGPLGNVVLRGNAHIFGNIIGGTVKRV